MELGNLQAVLTDTFNANFVLYYRSHQAHVNIKGRNFYQDHKLLKHVYKTLQDHIDDIGEKLRTIESHMPMSLQFIVGTSPIIDYACDGNSEEILQEILDGVLELMEQYHILHEEAEKVGYTDISNMADENIGEWGSNDDGDAIALTS